MKIGKKARKTLQNKEIFYEILFTSGKLGWMMKGDMRHGLRKILRIEADNDKKTHDLGKENAKEIYRWSISG